jgi:glycerol uptake facilitator-like aquaporin
VWVTVEQFVVERIGGLFLLAVFGNVENLGATLPGPGYVNWQALLMEVALTAGLVSGNWSSYWVYVVGPLAGALIAVGFAQILRGGGGDPISYAAGSGALDRGAFVAKQRLSQEIDRGDVVPPGIADADAPGSKP